MAGHSKWANIKHKKGAQDAKRGAIFGKLGRAIEVAARGGGDPTMNFRLKLAVAKAREANMPSSRIDSAIKKGSGADKSASNIEEVTYEGLGPGNVAIIIEALTDNKNRTVAEIRHMFSKIGGTFGSPVSWQFEPKGIIQALKNNQVEELELTAIEAGATNIEDLGDELEIHTDPKELDKVKTHLESGGFKISGSSLGLVPKTKITISDLSIAKKITNFLEELEDQEDVSDVYSNLDLPEDILKQLQSE